MLLRLCLPMAAGAPANPMQFPAQPSSAMAGGIIEIVLVIAADVELGSERQPVRARGCGRHVEPGFPDWRDGHPSLGYTGCVNAYVQTFVYDMYT